MAKSPLGAYGCGFAGVFVLAIMAGSFIIGLSYGTEEGQASENVAAVSTKAPASKDEWIAVYKYAGSLMKIEWEFLAAITKQETGMGNNFGRCAYFAPAPAGGHVLTTGNGLRSSADKVAFMGIMNKLGKPLNTPVSCNPSSGNGGAMGYTQFMPREWEGGANSAVVKIVGHYPDPWNATDATIMAGKLLKGKVGIGPEEAMPISEAIYRRAASKYFGDGNPNGKYASSVYGYYLTIKKTQKLI